MRYTMEKIKLLIGAQPPHISQIITGFLMLEKQGYEISFEYLPNDGSTLATMPAIRAEYRGKKLIYDVGDGYNVPESIVAGAAVLAAFTEDKITFSSLSDWGCSVDFLLAVCF